MGVEDAGHVKMPREIDFCDKTSDGRRQAISSVFCLLVCARTNSPTPSSLNLNYGILPFVAERVRYLSQTGLEDAPQRSPTRSVPSDCDYCFFETNTTMSCGIATSRQLGKREAMERGVIPLNFSN